MGVNQSLETSEDKCLCLAFLDPPWNIAAPEMLMMAYMLGFLVPDGCTWQGTCVPGEHSQTAAADDVHRCAH